MIKVIHIIAGLGSGGAENMLYKLLKYSDKGKFYHEVISLMDEGVMGEKIKEEGIKIHSLKLNKNNLLSSLIRARNICKEFDVVNTWLYHADFFGFIVSKILLKKKIIWNIRHSNLDKDVNKKRTLKLVKLNTKMSKYVNCITYNSHKAFETHKKEGYVHNNSKIIPNGFELDKFQFNLEDRYKIRKSLSINENEKVLITIGRWNPQKDYYTLIRALREVKLQNVNFKFIMVGTNLDKSNNKLISLINENDLLENIILLGRRSDIPALLSTADVYVSSSIGESFSNAIGEAMASGLSCIVTDVGDSKFIVGKTGTVINPKDYGNMARKIIDYISLPKIERNIDARMRVIEKYEIQSIVKIIENNILNL